MPDFGNAVELAIAGLTGGGVVELIRVFARRRRDNVEVSATLNEATLRWAADLKKDADSARDDANEAWKAAREARIEAQQERELMRREMQAIVAELQDARQMAERLTYNLRRVTGAIMMPTATIPHLREIVESDPTLRSINGMGS